VVAQVAEDAEVGARPAPSLDAEKRDWWPPGWADTDGVWNGIQVVTCEADIFQLLGLPYADPSDRDCPS
jgi:hypothetical protein